MTFHFLLGVLFCSVMFGCTCCYAGHDGIQRIPRPTLLWRGGYGNSFTFSATSSMVMVYGSSIPRVEVRDYVTGNFRIPPVEIDATTLPAIYGDALLYLVSNSSQNTVSLMALNTITGQGNMFGIHDIPIGDTSCWWAHPTSPNELGKYVLGMHVTWHSKCKSPLMYVIDLKTKVVTTLQPPGSGNDFGYVGNVFIRKGPPTLLITQSNTNNVFIAINMDNNTIQFSSAALSQGISAVDTTSVCPRILFGTNDCYIVALDHYSGVVMWKTYVCSTKVVKIDQIRCVGEGVIAVVFQTNSFRTFSLKNGTLLYAYDYNSLYTMVNLVGVNALAIITHNEGNGHIGTLTQYNATTMNVLWSKTYNLGSSSNNMFVLEWKSDEVVYAFPDLYAPVIQSMSLTTTNVSWYIPSQTLPYRFYDPPWVSVSKSATETIPYLWNHTYVVVQVTAPRYLHSAEKLSQTSLLEQKRKPELDTKEDV